MADNNEDGIFKKSFKAVVEVVTAPADIVNDLAVKGIKAVGGTPLPLPGPTQMSKDAVDVLAPAADVVIKAPLNVAEDVNDALVKGLKSKGLPTVPLPGPKVVAGIVVDSQAVVPELLNDAAVKGLGSVGVAPLPLPTPKQLAGEIKEAIGAEPSAADKAAAAARKAAADKAAAEKAAAEKAAAEKAAADKAAADKAAADKAAKEKINTDRAADAIGNLDMGVDNGDRTITTAINGVAVRDKKVGKEELSRLDSKSTNGIDWIDYQKEASAKAKAALIKQLDLNDDGVLTKAELDTAMKAAAEKGITIDKAELTRILNPVDSAEKAAAVQKPADNMQKAIDAIKKLDIGKERGRGTITDLGTADGEVSGTEIANQISARASNGIGWNSAQQAENMARQKEFVKAMDLNGDGTLTREELDKAVAAAKQSGVKVDANQLAWALGDQVKPNATPTVGAGESKGATK